MQQTQQPMAVDLDDLAALAAEHGVIKAGDPLPQGLTAFAAAIVEQCACIGDEYHDQHDGTAGDHIRGVWGHLQTN